MGTKGQSEEVDYSANKVSPCDGCENNRHCAKRQAACHEWFLWSRERQLDTPRKLLLASYTPADRVPERRYYDK